jgi:hypothetical protein
LSPLLAFRLASGVALMVAAGILPGVGAGPERMVDV